MHGIHKWRSVKYKAYTMQPSWEAIPIAVVQLFIHGESTKQNIVQIYQKCMLLLQFHKNIVMLYMDFTAFHTSIATLPLLLFLVLWTTWHSPPVEQSVAASTPCPTSCNHPHTLSRSRTRPRRSTELTSAQPSPPRQQPACRISTMQVANSSVEFINASIHGFEITS